MDRLSGHELRLLCDLPFHLAGRLAEQPARHDHLQPERCFIPGHQPGRNRPNVLLPRAGLEHGGAHNWGTNDVAYTTTYGQTVTNYPFSEGFESGNTHWAFDVPWAITPKFAHGGANSLGSNPGTNYASSTDASAYLSLDLSKANRPVLSFWELYAFQPNQDYGFVEVSKDQGANWASLYAVTGQGGSNWLKAQVPLDGYAGTQVLIRFRLLTSSGNALFGWFIDDVLVQDLATVLPYPFSDNMDTPASASNWLASAWQQYQSGVTTNGTDMSWRCLIGNGSTPGLGLNAYFTLAGTLNLSSASNPKLWFWWRAGAQANNTMDAAGLD